LSLRWVALTLGCVLLLAIGQMLFKVAAGGWRVEGWSLATLRNFLSAPMLAALVVYAIATFAWVFVLRHVPLGAAYRDRGRARARRAARRAPRRPIGVQGEKLAEGGTDLAASAKGRQVSHDAAAVTKRGCVEVGFRVT
jgi:hypothetical protein